MKRLLCLILTAALFGGILMLPACGTRGGTDTGTWLIRESRRESRAVPDTLVGSSVLKPSWELLTASGSTLILSHTRRMRGGYEDSDLMVYDLESDTVTASMTLPKQEKPVSAAFIGEGMFVLTAETVERDGHTVDTIYRTDLEQLLRSETITVSDGKVFADGVRYDVTPNGLNARERVDEGLFITQHKAGEASYRLSVNGSMYSVLNENDVPVIRRYCPQNSEVILLRNGSLLVQSGIPVCGADGGAPEVYDFCETENVRDADNGTVRVERYYTLHTLLISAEDGSETPLDVPGLICSVSSNHEMNALFSHDGAPILTDACAHVAWVQPIKDKQLIENTEIFFLSDDGALTPMPVWVPGQTRLPIRVSDDRFVVYTDDGCSFMCRGDGTVLCRLGEEVYRYQPEIRCRPSLFIDDGCLWDYDGRLLFDYEAEGLKLHDVLYETDTVVFTLSDDAWSMNSCFIWCGGALRQLADYEFQFTTAERDNMSLLMLYDTEKNETHIFSEYGEELGVIPDSAHLQAYAEGVMLLSAQENVYVVRQAKGGDVQ